VWSLPSSRKIRHRQFSPGSGRHSRDRKHCDGRDFGAVLLSGGWSGGGFLQLSAADLQEITDAIVRTGAGEGPTMPQLERAVAAH
jgi:hypothetical protein